jgi:hypothetical protein
MANYFDNIKNVAEHVVAESSRLKATTAGHIYDLEMIEDTDNGTIVAVGAHVEGQLFKAKEYTTSDKPYLVLTTPLAYNGKKAWSAEKYFYNANGEIARAYELYVDDIYTVSANAFTGTPAVGKFVDATHTIKDAAPDAGFAGEIIEEVTYTNSVSYRVRVVAIA